jgi:hypothetical protein
VELHVAIFISCGAAFKALIQKHLPGLLGRSIEAIYSTTRKYHGHPSRTADAYALGSRTHENDGTYFTTTIRAANKEPDDCESQEQIVVSDEGVRLDTTISIRSSSRVTVDGADDGKADST